MQKERARKRKAQQSGNSEGLAIERIEQNFNEDGRVIQVSYDHRLSKEERGAASRELPPSNPKRYLREAVLRLCQTNSKYRHPLAFLCYMSYILAII